MFASDYHSLADNVVSGNNQHGIWINGTVTTNNVTSPAESLLLEGNFVGTDESGLLALPNGQDGIQLVGYGSVETFHQVRDNVVAANGLAGIHVSARRVTLLRNLVGVNAEQDPLGNGTDGIRLSSTAAYASVEEWNVIGDNGGDGIEISADDVVVDHAVLGTDLAGGNTPHPPDPLGNTRRMGNGGAGIRVNYGSRGRLTDNTIWDSGGDGIALETSGFSVIDDWTVSGNEVRYSGGSGLSVAGIIQAVEWLENRVSDSGACPYDVSPTANSSLAAPTITTRTPWRVAGTHAGAFVWRVDVYVGEDEAERWVGRATLLPGNQYELVLGDLDLPIPDQARVIAIASTSDGRSSPAQGWCAEGCAHAAASNSCYDGDFCTQDTCGGGGCTWPSSNAGLACDDGNACTTASTCQAGSCTGTAFVNPATNTACTDDDPCSEGSTCKANGVCSGPSNHICDDEDPCTQEVPECSPTEGCPTTPRPIGYQCEDGDLCTVHGTCDALGACVLPTTPPVVDCPMDTQCNDCVCVPEDGCSCTGICGDGKCGPDDFFADAGAPCAECLDTNGVFDTDQDGFPNIWEAPNTIDIDCDGTADYGPGSPRTNELTEGVRDLFLEIDYMADGQSGEGSVGNPPRTHEHYPYRVEDNTGVGNLFSVFAAQGIALHVDISDELPHTELIVAQPLRTPLWREGEWVQLRDLHRENFDHRTRRGLYHYQVVAHTVDSRNVAITGLGEVGDESVVGLETHDAVDAALGTILHEIGHNLNLGHGGLGDGNHEPNFVSVMNYGYPTLTKGTEVVEVAVDYSWNELLPVDEEAGVPEDCAMWCELTPTEGPLYNVTWECPPDAERDRDFGPPHAAPVGGLVPLGGMKMDLDCNGILSDTAIVTHPLDPENRATAYEGGDDWASIDLAFQKWSFSTERFGDSNAAEPSRTLFGQHWPRTSLYPGGAPRVVPRVGAAYRVPIVVYGAADFDASAFTAPVVRGAAAVVDAVDDFDLDGFDDRWLEYRAVDLVGLASTATSLHLYSSFPSSGDEVYAKWPITRANSPADTDGDGLQNAVDGCDDTPPAANRGPDGCPWP